ncbi:hypothetical protein CBM2598_U10113 [Cupriavidus taiwanensis]|uniref:Uncharacterized protein n=1 Tax=Cupriavidus taiwanensis TaxID=164546 RepID=A0A7Z7NR47_9BURK|nr:hypothetical protein CBM2597_U10239 [Cupriavidus taiwanensis]SOZ96301.1 hypothetical protein CBM2598_U10113 [Cupriavidus taiwanensis]SPC25744.1 hypothetical protein CBM2594_U10245 [Cupriavidus taiwanensis]
MTTNRAEWSCISRRAWASALTRRKWRSTASGPLCPKARSYITIRRWVASSLNALAPDEPFGDALSPGWLIALKPLKFQVLFGDSYAEGF